MPHWRYFENIVPAESKAMLAFKDEMFFGLINQHEEYRHWHQSNFICRKCDVR